MAPPVSFCCGMSAIFRFCAGGSSQISALNEELEMEEMRERETNRAAQQFKWKWNGKEPKWPMFIFNLYAAATVGGDGGARSEGSTDADGRCSGDDPP